MSLTINWNEFFGDGTNHGIYTENASWKDSSDERASSLEFFTADGSEQFQIDAAVEIQGHSSTTRWNTDKLSLQVKFKTPYDDKLESSTLFGNSAVDGSGAADEFDSLILDAQFNYTWLHQNVQQNGVAKYVNDQLVSDYINLVGGNSPHGRWVHRTSTVSIGESTMPTSGPTIRLRLSTLAVRRRITMSLRPMMA